jgi:mono/diheme cytochrome c family protein
MKLRRAISASLLLVLPACGEAPPEADPADPLSATVLALDIPAEFAEGEVAFQANCASCHGERALGSDQGPPLVHIIYEPSHHADIAFFMAADRGVRAHHWQFGDMPPVPTVSNEQMTAIVAYVRYLQRQVGIV